MLAPRGETVLAAERLVRKNPNEVKGFGEPHFRELEPARPMAAAG
jgi:hypothetical protein